MESHFRVQRSPLAMNSLMLFLPLKRRSDNSCEIWKLELPSGIPLQASQFRKDTHTGQVLAVPRQILRLYTQYQLAFSYYLSFGLVF